MNANSTTALKAPKIVWWMIWGAMSFSIILYAIILQVVGGDAGTDVAAAQKGGVDFKDILLPIAIVAVVISFSIRFLLTCRQAKHADESRRIRAFSTYIASLALAESAAIYGLVLGLQGAPMDDYGTFFVIGFLAVILQPPTVLFPSKGDDFRDQLRGG